MRTGKKGYYKRLDVAEKSCRVDVTVHDSDNAPGAPADLGNRAFNHATSAVARTAPDPMEALDLPFFRLGNHPQLGFGSNRVLAPVHSVSASSADVSAHAVFPDGSGRMADEEDDACMALSDEEQEEKSCVQPMLSAMDVVNSLFQKQSGGSSKQKLAAKPTPKPATKPATTNSNKPSKRKGVAKDSADKEESVPKIQRLQDVKTPPCLEVAVSAAPGQKPEMSNADKTMVAGLEEELEDKLKKRVFATLKENDVEVTDTLKKAAKDLTAYVNKVKGKKKSLKRRNNSDTVCGALQELIDEAQSAAEVANELANVTGTRETFMTIERLKKTSWTVSLMAWKRMFKCMAIQSLKFTDWVLFFNQRQLIHDNIGFTNGEQHWEFLVSEILQRLLRSLSAKDHLMKSYSYVIVVIKFF